MQLYFIRHGQSVNNAGWGNPNYKDNQRKKREISNDFTSFHIILALSNYALRFKQKIAQREIPAVPDGLHNPAKSFPKSGSRDRSFVVNTG